MADVFPVRFPDQLRQHLRALRKKHGLTQSQLGALVGVSQARIAEIEANPGLVNFEQVMKLLSALGVSLMLQEEAAAASAPSAKASRPITAQATQSKPPSAAPVTQPASKRSFLARPRKGSW